MQRVGLSSNTFSQVHHFGGTIAACWPYYNSPSLILLALLYMFAIKIVENDFKLIHTMIILYISALLVLKIYFLFKQISSSEYSQKSFIPSIEAHGMNSLKNIHAAFIGKSILGTILSREGGAVLFTNRRQIDALNFVTQNMER